MIPQCAHKRCKRPAMPQCPVCIRHWQKARGWNAKRGRYDEPLPFEQGPDDAAWDDALERTGATSQA